MIKENKLNNLIEDDEIKKLRDFLVETLDSTGEDGLPSLEKIKYNATFNMGEGAAEIGTLVFQEKNKLETMEDEYRVARRIKYEKIMNDRMAFNPTSEGVRIMVDGDPMLSSQKKELENQRLYVELLVSMQETIRYYPRNAQHLINVATFGKDIGKIL